MNSLLENIKNAPNDDLFRFVLAKAVREWPGNMKRHQRTLVEEHIADGRWTIVLEETRGDQSDWLQLLDQICTNGYRAAEVNASPHKKCLWWVFEILKRVGANVAIQPEVALELALDKLMSDETQRTDDRGETYSPYDIAVSVAEPPPVADRSELIARKALVHGFSLYASERTWRQIDKLRIALARAHYRNGTCPTIEAAILLVDSDLLHGTGYHQSDTAPVVDDSN